MLLSCPGPGPVQARCGLADQRSGGFRPGLSSPGRPARRSPRPAWPSNGGGNCVEVADHGNRVLVRDTQTRSGPVLWFSPNAWRGLVEQVKAGGRH
ncbi:MAG TPA: DUF397 domain-containing protein [Streptosporangiaceae bacterium]|nr:DUF397 domain-containing protein [Streptosporangiaceae bacterium]